MPARPARPAHPLQALCRLLALSVCLLIFSTAAASAQAPAAPPGAPSVGKAGVQVGLEGARLVDFIRFLGQFMGSAPVFREDQIPQAQVTVVAPEPMGEADVRELLALVLRPAGLEASLRGGVAYVLPAPPQGPPPHLRGLPEGARILAWRLRDSGPASQASAVAGVLERLRSERGQVLRSDRARLVVLADAPERAERLRPVLAALSALPEGQSPEIYPLSRLGARQAARVLDMQLKGRPGAPLVMALEWSNSLLLAGTPAGLAQARMLASQADGSGPEAPVLKAYRPRHVRPDKILAALEEFVAKAPSGKDGGLAAEGTRLRLDEGGQAVLALAAPEVLERMDRLVEDLDQPRLRVYIEALVAELPARSLAELSLTGGQPAGEGGVKSGQARLGTGVSFRGRVADAPQLGLDALAALLASAEGVRVLAVPRMAVLDGAEAKVLGGAVPAASGGQEGGPAAAGKAGGERFRLSLAPRLGQGGPGRIDLRVTLEDALGATPAQSVEARLGEGQVLLLGGQEDGPASGGAGWALFSPARKQEGAGRLVVLVIARVVRPAAPERGAAPGAAGQKASGEK